MIRLQRYANNPYLLSGIVVLLVGALLFVVLLLTDRLETPRTLEEALQQKEGGSPLARPKFAEPGEEGRGEGRIGEGADLPAYEAEAPPPYEGEGGVSPPPYEASPPAPSPPPSKPSETAQAPVGEKFEFPEPPLASRTAVRWQPKGMSRVNIRYSQPVFISSDPPGADIYFNGEKTKEKTPCAFLLPVPHSYAISVSKERYIPPPVRRIIIRSTTEKIPPFHFQLREIPQEP